MQCQMTFAPLYAISYYTINKCNYNPPREIFPVETENVFIRIILSVNVGDMLSQKQY